LPQSLLTGSIWSGVNQGTSKLYMVAYTLLLSRSAGPAGLGLLLSAQAIAYMGLGAWDCGIAGYVTRQYALVPPGTTHWRLRWRPVVVARLLLAPLGLGTV